MESSLLNSNPDLAKKISPESLNAILPETAGEDTGKSAVSFLCGTLAGRAFLNSNPDLAKKTPQKTNQFSSQLSF